MSCGATNFSALKMLSSDGYTVPDIYWSNTKSFNTLKYSSGLENNIIIKLYRRCYYCKDCSHYFKKNNPFSSSKKTITLQKDLQILNALKDKNKTPVNGYALCKGEKSVKEADTLACVELPGETTTTFYIEVILPTNYVGGMENSLTLSNQKTMPTTYSSPLQKVPKDFSYTGREYIKWDNYELYK
jgi:hypothetical protein